MAQITFKIKEKATALGAVSESQMTLTVSSDNFRYALGKALFSNENISELYVTNDVFWKIAEDMDEIIAQGNYSKKAQTLWEAKVDKENFVTVTYVIAE